MEITQSNLEQLILAEKQATAAEFVLRIDDVISAVPGDKETRWPLGFPAKKGHAGLGLRGHEGYETQPGELEIHSVKDGYTLTLWSTNDQKLGRPHTLQSGPKELAITDSLYDGLQVLIRPKSNEPLVFKWIIRDWKEQPFLGVPDKSIRLFADICILQAEIKTGLKPSPAQRLAGAVGLTASAGVDGQAA